MDKSFIKSPTNTVHVDGEVKSGESSPVEEKVVSLIIYRVLAKTSKRWLGILGISEASTVAIYRDLFQPGGRSPQIG